ncbi:arsenate reductase (azurin) small subunit [Rhodopseudomonas palustris]|uniref:arsenate reductase (azurin) small subunit n=1 Tax=Rhodopseudomonas palustris TaxID=1076 RepID=UPI002ACD46E7|nr:arsenate reductase (azurin) small subunit [Rhodopseudomonas palustris]WQH02000.1 arsenate reductase (azurin) small subunit [Rhodopseudomonas palustris]
MKRCNNQVDAGRRRFLSGASLAAAGAAVTTMLPTEANAAPTSARINYPSNRLANLSQLKLNEPFEVSYPDKDAPGVLLKLGTRVEGGIGPQGDIVGFSTVCPHKGFPLHYTADDKTLTCTGHYARYDCEKAGQQIWGHATQNLAQYALRVDGKGDIYADGVDELLYGRLSNVL